MSAKRTFPTTAAARYDRALRKSLKLHPPPPETAVPAFTDQWPAENVALLEQYRAWLVGIGAADTVINQHRIPMAGHLLGLSGQPHPQLNLTGDFDRAMQFVQARGLSEQWLRNCHHSLDWFRRFLKVERGLVILDQPAFGDVSRYQAGLPDWLIGQLTKFLHLRQANWRPSRLTQMTYQFWYQATQIWRWLFTHTPIQAPNEITRDHLFTYIDEQLVAGYKVSSINHDLHTFQGTLRFLQQQGMAVPHALLTLPGLKKPHALPRFLTDAQVVALRDDLRQRLEKASTAAAKRSSHLDLALFYLLWQCGLRVSELEDLALADVDLVAGTILIREAKGLKDRAVYLTPRAADAVQAYLAVRGPALTDHLFIYRHKPLSKDFVRSRLHTASKRLGFKITPHMLRHTFATQLLNAGANITTIQALLGHQRLNTTMTYARVHDKTVMADYVQAMAQIEGKQAPLPQNIFSLLDKLEKNNLDDEQKQTLEEIRRCLVTQTMD
ncbi:MAG: tyrosine-type recombinase/integrase [Anaerolineales bacterium]|nr:tyrosine-type recombinase/integrase [Anaerolineales bacterium]MCA9974795.1 tyrosine-type recombinase/integrase [Anaerolineales bacterium]